MKAKAERDASDVPAQTAPIAPHPRSRAAATAPNEAVFLQVMAQNLSGNVSDVLAAPLLSGKYIAWNRVILPAMNALLPDDAKMDSNHETSCPILRSMWQKWKNRQGNWQEAIRAIANAETDALAAPAAAPSAKKKQEDEASQKGTKRPRSAVSDGGESTVSAYCGVSFIPVTGKWKARIHIQGKTKNIGTFTFAEEAARKYDEEAARHGMPMNFPLHKDQTRGENPDLHFHPHRWCLYRIQSWSSHDHNRKAGLQFEYYLPQDHPVT